MEIFDFLLTDTLNLNLFHLKPKLIAVYCCSRSLHRYLNTLLALKSTFMGLPEVLGVQEAIKICRKLAKIDFLPINFTLRSAKLTLSLNIQIANAVCYKQRTQSQLSAPY